ncbi:hypothetical protein GCM10023196_034950 [Actinoallomurus vinaceus]|uniref:DNRLRE domain-containing protein n=2 Tax=Actinoallomurus vinaceus TaxID=1080074 RepID=A0ABP8UAC1_9ACTN
MVSAGVAVFTLSASMTVSLGTPSLAAVGASSRPVPRHAQQAPSIERAEAAAVRKAKESDSPVEVLAERTETRQVMAQPDGTFSSDESLLPRWVKGPDGTWQPVDPTLRATKDGTVMPKAVPVRIRLSGGGRAPLLQSTDRGRSITLTWQGRLPKPTLSGNTATYAVRPGVDLRLTVSALNVSQEIVIKSRKATADPALKRLTFGLQGSGISFHTNASGGIDATAANGVSVSHLPPARMRDSTGRTGPVERTHESVLPLETGAGTMAVVPDQKMLGSSDTRFPVVIALSDPTPEWSGSKQHWVMIDQAHSTETYWDSSHRPEVGAYTDPDTGAHGIKRSFFRMDSDNVNGKHILKATFRIEQTYSYGCTKTPSATEIYFTGGIHGYTTWKRQPSWGSPLDSVAKDAGHDSSCPDDDDEFNVTSAVVTAARKGLPNTTFGLKDRDDTTSSDWGWKGFSSNPHLVIKYNTVPKTPYGQATNPGTECTQGANRPVINPNSTPAKKLTLKTQLYDPDKDIKTHNPDDQVRAEYEVNHYNATSKTWEMVGARLYSSFIPSGSPSTVSVDVPAASFKNGEVYRWHVWAWDGTDNSAWSSWCEFGVDSTAPDQVPQISSTDYPDDEPTDPADWHGGVGRAGTFTFSPGSAETGVTAYRYALDYAGQATAATQVSASTPVQITPKHQWVNKRFVYPVDAAGNVGTRYAEYDFYVKPLSVSGAPVGHWALDDGTGNTAADSASGGHPITWTGGATWGSGRIGGGGHLNGSTNYGETSGPVTHTDAGFTVSAWVRLTDSSHTATVAAQAGSVNSGFQLYRLRPVRRPAAKAAVAGARAGRRTRPNRHLLRQPRPRHRHGQRLLQRGRSRDDALHPEELCGRPQSDADDVQRHGMADRADPPRARQ